MEEQKQMIKIPLQFFGESDDDFDDELDTYDEDDGYVDDFEDGGEEDGEDGNGGGEDAVGEEGGDGSDEDRGSGGADGDGGAKGDHAELVADLKALGFKGDDLESIKASVKARREAKEKGDAADERKAAQAAGKSHIKGSKPRKGAGGDGSGGVTERRVIGFAERTGCTKEEARKTLAKHARMIQGG